MHVHHLLCQVAPQRREIGVNTAFDRSNGRRSITIESIQSLQTNL
jgi:hypothetical protein